MLDDGRKRSPRHQHATTVLAQSHRMGIVEHRVCQRLVTDRARHLLVTVSENSNAVGISRFRKMKRAAITAEEIAASGEEFHGSAAVPAIHASMMT
jgi:hypothetical protein